MDYELRFDNKSDETNESTLVVYQKDVATDLAPPPLAWKIALFQLPALDWQMDYSILPVSSPAVPPSGHPSRIELHQPTVLGDAVPPARNEANSPAPFHAPTVPVGTVMAFPFILDTQTPNAAERLHQIESSGWMPCDGRKLLVAKYPELFAALGHRNGQRGLVVIPSLDLIASWNDTTLGDKPGNPLRTDVEFPS